MQYREALMPHYRNRPGYALKSTSITTHNTANPNATAANHVTFLNATPRSASWHICVDDVEAVLQIPLNEQAWHAGTNAGNTTSIGIEVCEFTDPSRQAAAIDNAARLIAAMQDGTAPPAFRATHITSVRTHQSWSGKYCPRVILPNWDAFVQKIASYRGAATGGDDVLKLLDPVPAGVTRIYRLYNPTNGDHLPTASVEEANRAVAQYGYQFEDRWFDLAGDTPLYRLYNQATGEHIPVLKAERDALVAAGWKDEGVLGYCSTSAGAPVYRRYNGTLHMHSLDKNEAATWPLEGNGIAFYTGVPKAVGDCSALEAKVTELEGRITRAKKELG